MAQARGSLIVCRVSRETVGAPPPNHPRLGEYC